jgi:hypothetical protein
MFYFIILLSFNLFFPCGSPRNQSIVASQSPSRCGIPDIACGKPPLIPAYAGLFHQKVCHGSSRNWVVF